MNPLLMGARARRLPSQILVVLAALLLSACGGGGGGSGSGSGSGGVSVTDDFAVTPVALDLQPKPIKTFRFTWDEVPDAQEYRLLEDADGVSGYSTVATLAAGETEHDLEVFLPGRVNARYVLQACNAAGVCADSPAVHVAGTLAEEVGYVKPVVATSQFGSHVALSADGHTLAVGAVFDDSGATGINGDWSDTTALNSGAVYVYVGDGTGQWSQQAYVKASNTGALDRFGTTLALSGDGNTLVVGAAEESSAATGTGGNQGDNTALNSGAVYVFVRNAAGVWSQQEYVKASNTEGGDRFGQSVALSGDGDTLVVGADDEDSAATGIDGDQTDNSASDSGAVYVFVRSAVGVWSQQAYVKASNAGAGDGFGEYLALSGSGGTLAVGAFREDSAATGIDGDDSDDSANLAGAAYVFVRDGAGVWSQQAYVKASNTEIGDSFGFGVTLSGTGDTLAVTASLEDSAATGIGGDQTDNSAMNSGAAYVFVRNAVGAWSQQAYVKASNPGAGDGFGRSVALSATGDKLAVGAPYEGSGAIGIGGEESDDSATLAGAVYVFVHDGATGWAQQAYVKAPNTDSGDVFGHRVALSADGDTLAVGAQQEASAATGIGGDQSNNAASNSGAVYLY